MYLKRGLPSSAPPPLLRPRQHCSVHAACDTAAGSCASPAWRRRAQSPGQLRLPPPRSARPPRSPHPHAAADVVGASPGAGPSGSGSRRRPRKGKEGERGRGAACPAGFCLGTTAGERVPERHHDALKNKEPLVLHQTCVAYERELLLREAEAGRRFSVRSLSCPPTQSQHETRLTVRIIPFSLSLSRSRDVCVPVSDVRTTVSLLELKFL